MKSGLYNNGKNKNYTLDFQKPYAHVIFIVFFFIIMVRLFFNSSAPFFLGNASKDILKGLLPRNKNPSIYLSDMVFKFFVLYNATAGFLFTFI